MRTDRIKPRDVVIVTADLMGDPTPEHRQRQAEVDSLIRAHDAHTRDYMRAYAKGYRARKG